MSDQGLILVALSGGVDSAVAALLLKREGRRVECLHMTNWVDDDGYCRSAEDYQDARRIAAELGLTLHRVNFAAEYYAQVFEDFLTESRAGRTPNPDVLCNREIKFGLLRRYARRLGAERMATGHYARLEMRGGRLELLKARDTAKDQSYFLHAVDRDDLADALFPLGDLTKAEVRALAAEAGLAVADKRDSTGICFIGERPFADFLSRYIEGTPGRIVTPDGEPVGMHRGLAFYTLGQRQGLGIGGLSTHGAQAWYVAGKDPARNELIAVQGRDHPALYQNWLAAEDMNWLAVPPPEWATGAPIECSAKTRYRQADRGCSVLRTGAGSIEVSFFEPQWAVTPGQYVVLYRGELCLGGARIVDAAHRSLEDRLVRAG